MIEFVRNWLTEYGAISDGWRIKIADVTRRSAGSDWLLIDIYIFKPRAKKPFYFWEMCVNEVRKIVDFEKCTYHKI